MMPRRSIVLLLAVATLSAGANAPKPDKKQVDQLLATGAAQIAKSQFEAAATTYQQLITLDPENAIGWEGLAIAQVVQENHEQAAKAIKQALQLTPAPDRALAFNAASVYFRCDLPLDAAVLIAKYMEAHPTPLDEPMIEALGTAIHSAQLEEDVDLVKLAGAQACLDKFNSQLEAPAGKVRWGSTWVDQAEGEVKLSAYKEQQAKIADIQQEMAEVAKKIPAADRQATALEAQAKKKGKNQRQVKKQAEEARRAANQLVTDHRSLETDLSRVYGGMEIPPFPEKIGFLAFDRTKPPKLGEPETYLAESEDPTKTATDTEKPVEAPKPPVAPEKPKPAEEVNATVVPQRHVAAFPIARDLYLVPMNRINGKKEVHVQGQNDSNIGLKVLRSDTKSGLALLRITGNDVAFLNLAAEFKGGTVNCAAFPEDSGMFDATANLVAGTAKVENGALAIRLNQPAAVGSPVLVKGRVVGLITNIDTKDPTKCAGVTLEQIRAFLGSDAPKVTAVTPDPATTVVKLIEE